MISIIRVTTAIGFLALVGMCSSMESFFGTSPEGSEEAWLEIIQDPPEKADPKNTDPAKDASKKTDPAKDSPKKDGDTKKTDPAKDTPKKDGDTKKGDPTKDTPKKDGDPKKDADSKKGSGTAALLNKSNPKKTSDKTDPQKSPYVKLQTATGKISKFEEAGGVITIKVEQPYIVKREVKKKEFEIKAILTDDVKIRILNPPPLYDDKGRMKRYTAKELKELRGEDTKTPGFPADTGDLVNNAMVQLDLVLKKEDYKKLKSKKKSDDPLPEVPSTNLIIVIAPPPPSP